MKKKTKYMKFGFVIVDTTNIESIICIPDKLIINIIINNGSRITYKCEFVNEADFTNGWEFATNNFCEVLK